MFSHHYPLYVPHTKNVLIAQSTGSCLHLPLTFVFSLFLLRPLFNLTLPLLYSHSLTHISYLLLLLYSPLHLGLVLFCFVHAAECGTTESVWACLHCQHFGCGRAGKKHALDHFKETGHPCVVLIGADKYVMRKSSPHRYLMTGRRDTGTPTRVLSLLESVASYPCHLLLT